MIHKKPFRRGCYPAVCQSGFSQVGQSDNNRLTDLAARLSRESGISQTRTTAHTPTPSATTETKSRLYAHAAVCRLRRKFSIAWWSIAAATRNCATRSICFAHARSVERNNLQKLLVQHSTIDFRYGTRGIRWQPWSKSPDTGAAVGR